MRIGIFGAGMIVFDFLTFASTVPNLTIKAISATKEEEEKLKKICLDHDIPEYYTDVDEMLQNKDIDTIYVAVPNHLHFLFTKKAILAGKNAIVEKPFTSNYKEAMELAELAKKHNVIVLEAVSTRYLPNIKKIKETLPELGSIKIVSANYSQYSSRYDAFKSGQILPAFDPLKSGGALMDLNIYNINLVVTLFGKPKSLDYKANIERGIDTSGILTLDYGSFKCVCIAAKDCKAPIATNIQGDEGCITISTPANSLQNYTVLMNKANPNAKQSTTSGGEKLDFNMGHHRMYHEFVEFERIISENDLVTVNEMMDITLTTMEIQTEARKKAHIEFGADVKKSETITRNPDKQHLNSLQFSNS